MMTRNPPDWMWTDALGMLARAERVHRQFFQPSVPKARQASWEPPVDVLETEAEVFVIAALPGVVMELIEASIDGSCLLIAGERAVPAALRNAVIHRMELPQGRFERRVPLPSGRYDAVTRQVWNGCLIINLRKAA